MKRYSMTSEDNERQHSLNRELNPLQTIPNEATQTINPVTGRAYEDFGRDGDNQEQSIANRMVGELKPNKFLYSKDELDYVPRNPSGLEFFNYQLALARKEIRKRKDKGEIIPWELVSSVNSVNGVIQKLEEAGLPLTTINTVSGLDDAIESLELEKGREYTNKINKDFILIHPGNISDLYLEKYPKGLNSNLTEILNKAYLSRNPRYPEEDRDFKDKWLN